ncbi:ATP-binding cassette domain-containing protein [Puniceicoccus vermicola]|uniref:ATP-binding cassette domain-containing protein n=1 Tax=Puniceicoccus vermicola TaxID=388746 RepID=A0A7X1E2X8_9BACT|nr:ATP-binding cassette domain-containing protein [Puniceicoccus vermicola]MBC2600379.1 ATP-binding cassette domain-containing protein [Puniceicoccus vermicola]
MSLEVKGLGKRYGRQWVLRDIDWCPEPGTISALIGMNGAGKTTLLNLLAGLYVGSCGEVRLAGFPLRRHQVALRRKLFFIPDIR